MRRRARTAGDLAWIGSESELHTEKDGKPLVLLSTETMVLKQMPEGWRIVHIHRSEEHTSELQSLLRISYAVFCLKNKNNTMNIPTTHPTSNTHKHPHPKITTQLT